MVKKGVKTEHRSAKKGFSPFQTQISQKKLFQEEYYFEDNLTEKEFLQSKQPSEISQLASKHIKKQRKHKKHNPDDRFLKEHEKKYYLFPFIYYTENPFFKISWGQWKPNSIYKRMSAVLSQSHLIPGKTSIQCKSFDQRMKNEHFVNPSESNKQDLLQSSLSYFQREGLEPTDLDIIQDYVGKMAEKGPYMVFLQQTADVEEIDLQAARLECELKREESDLTEGKEDYEILFNEFFDLF